MVSSASFSPDGSRIVTASADHTARVWDAKTGQPLGSPLDHISTVTSASFSPDGSRIVTASGDNTARVWDATVGAPLESRIAEQFTTFVAGTRLDPALGSLQAVSMEERMEIWKTLEPALAAMPDWHFAAELALPRDP